MIMRFWGNACSDNLLVRFAVGVVGVLSTEGWWKHGGGGRGIFGCWERVVGCD